MEYHPYPCAAPDPTVRPILLYHVGQVGLSNGIPPIPQCCPRSHCPSYPTVPCRTGGTHHPYPCAAPDPTVRPILLYHVGQVGLSNGIPPIPLCCPRSHCPSYPTVPYRTGGTSNGIPPIPQCCPRSHCPSYPTGPCRTGGTSNGLPPTPQILLYHVG